MEDKVIQQSFTFKNCNRMTAQAKKTATNIQKRKWQVKEMEEYDEFNIGVQFKAAATVSITYALMSRCGLEPERYFDHEDFMAIFDFNTPATIGALGTAVSQINQQVLRQIGVTVRNAEREANQERSKQDEQSHDLYPERRLSDSRPEAEPAAGETPGQVRQDEENLPEGTPSHPLQPDVAEREAVPAPSGDRRDRPEQTGADDAPAGEGSGSHRGTESQRSHEVGGADEHLQSSGRGDPDGGAYQQLTLNLFLSEAEQIQSIDEAENVAHTSSAFSFAKMTSTMCCVWAAIQTVKGSVWLLPLKSRKPPLRLPRY